MVIEEIKNEMQLTGLGRLASSGNNLGRPSYVDPFSRLDAQTADSV